MKPYTMTVADAQSALRLGKTTLYSLLADGRLCRLKVGRRTLITIASIERFHRSLFCRGGPLMQSQPTGSKFKNRRRLARSSNATAARSSAPIAPEKFSAQMNTAIDSWIPDVETRQLVKAYLGNEGHALSQPCSDEQYRGRWIAGASTEIARFHAQSTERRLVRIEAYDDFGITSALRPIVRISAVTNKLMKALAALRLDGISFAQIRGFYDHPSLVGQPGLLVNSRAIASISSDTSGEKLLRDLAQSGKFKSSLGPASVTISPVDVDEISAAIGWVFELPKGALQIAVGESGPALVESSRYSVALKMRLLEFLSQTEFSECVFASGELRKTLSILKKSMTAWQNGRLADQRCLPLDRVPWELWFDLRRRFGPKSCLPIRVDFVPAANKSGRAPSKKPARADRSLRHNILPKKRKLARVIRRKIR